MMPMSERHRIPGDTAEAVDDCPVFAAAKITRHKKASHFGRRRPLGANRARQRAAFRDGRRRPIGAETGMHAANSRHGRRKPIGAETGMHPANSRHGRPRPIGAKTGMHAANSRHGRRRPTIHDFNEISTVRRGWPSLEDHDDGRTTPCFSTFGRTPTMTRRGRRPAPVLMGLRAP